MLSFLPIRIVDPKISLLYKSGESSHADIAVALELALYQLLNW